MISNKEIYKIWAPKESKWSPWVRPVPFIFIDNDIKSNEYEEFDIPNILYLNNEESTFNNAAIIVDLPSNKSINEGIALASIGYIPVPIYNGTDEQIGSNSVVNNRVIELGLIWGAEKLMSLNKSLDKDASPAFLTDSNRMNRYKASAGVFDNSWDVYPQDLPTAEFFKNAGIDKIIVRSDILRKDLNKILYKFQIEGLKIYFTEGYEEPKLIKVKNIRYKN